MTVVIHTAALPVPHVQRCARCGEVLIDRTNEVYTARDSDPLRWWEGNVAVEGPASWATTEPATCRPRPRS